MSLGYLAVTALSIGFNLIAGLFAPKPETPDLNLTVPKSDYGQTIPIPIGRCRLEGNKFLFSNFGEIYDERGGGGGGKGGGGGGDRPPSVFGNFGALLCQEPTTLESVILNGKSIDINSDFFSDYITFVDGSQTTTWFLQAQKSDPPFDQIVYFNQAYLGFEDLPLEDYGNQIPQQVAGVCYNTQLGATPQLNAVIDFICDRAGIDPSLYDTSELASTTMNIGFPLVEDGDGYAKAIEELMRFYLFTAIERDGQIVFKFINRDAEPAFALTNADIIQNDRKDYKRNPQEFIEFPAKFDIKFNSIQNNYDADTFQVQTNLASKKLSEEISFNLNCTREEIEQRSWLFVRYLLYTSATKYELSLTAEAVARLDLEELDKLLLPNGEIIQIDRIDRRDDYSVAIEANAYLANLNYDGSAVVIPPPTSNTPPIADPPLADLYIIETSPWNSKSRNRLYQFADSPCRIQVGTSSTSFSQQTVHSRASTMAIALTTLPNVAGEVLDSGETIDIEVDTGLFEGIGNFNSPAFINGQINLCLLAKQATSGSWIGELIQFGAVTALPTQGQFRLSQINRGLFNSASVRNTNTNVVSQTERLFLLNDADGLAYFSELQGSVDYTTTTLFFRAIVKPWQDLGSTPVIQVTPRGISYQAPAVSNFASQQDSADNIQFTWDFNPPSATQVTGLENVSYEIDIVFNSSIVRTLTTENKSIVYTVGDRTSDGVTFPFDATIYAVSPLVGRGAGSTITVTEDLTPDTIEFTGNNEAGGIRGKRFINGTTDALNPVTYVVQESDNGYQLIVQNATAEAYTNLQFDANLPIGFEVYVLHSKQNPIVSRTKLLVPTFLPEDYQVDVNRGKSVILTHLGNGEYSVIGNLQPIVRVDGVPITTLKNIDFVSGDNSVTFDVSEPNAETTEIDVRSNGANANIQTVTIDTTLAPNEQKTIDINPFARLGDIVKVESNVPVRVRLAYNNAFRSADLTRLITERLPQTEYHGVYADIFVDPPPNNTSIVVPIRFYNDDANGYFTIDNLTTVTQSNVNIVITYG